MSELKLKFNLYRLVFFLHADKVMVEENKWNDSTQQLEQEKYYHITKHKLTKWLGYSPWKSGYYPPKHFSPTLTCQSCFTITEWINLPPGLIHFMRQYKIESPFAYWLKYKNFKPYTLENLKNFTEIPEIYSFSLEN